MQKLIIIKTNISQIRCWYHQMTCMDPNRAEQLKEYVKNVTFRLTLVVSSDVVLD